MFYDVQYTDTFGGEANYSWVRRAVVRCDSESQAAIMRVAKAAVGLTGTRGVTLDAGDCIEFRPYRSCTVMFVSLHDCPGTECPCEEVPL